MAETKRGCRSGANALVWLKATGSYPKTTCSISLSVVRGAAVRWGVGAETGCVPSPVAFDRRRQTRCALTSQGRPPQDPVIEKADHSGGRTPAGRVRPDDAGRLDPGHRRGHAAHVVPGGRLARGLKKPNGASRNCGGRRRRQQRKDNILPRRSATPRRTPCRMSGATFDTRPMWQRAPAGA